ncbi:MAG: hypothetical protein KDA42_12980 [Planctomycetales bacterium]|nr:hypothetical protein [Planctomycetales bacterium]
MPTVAESTAIVLGTFDFTAMQHQIVQEKPAQVVICQARISQFSDFDGEVPMRSLEFPSIAVRLQKQLQSRVSVEMFNHGDLLARIEHSAAEASAVRCEVRSENQIMVESCNSRCPLYCTQSTQASKIPPFRE